MRSTHLHVRRGEPEAVSRGRAVHAEGCVEGDHDVRLALRCLASPCLHGPAWPQRLSSLLLVMLVVVAMLLLETRA